MAYYASSQLARPLSCLLEDTERPSITLWCLDSVWHVCATLLPSVFCLFSIDKDVCMSRS